jgi:hypothetical protein
MDCYLCKAAATEKKGHGGRLPVDCPGCGNYEISSSAIGMISSRRVDVEALRPWLDAQRESPQDAPYIGSGQISQFM